MLFAGALAEIWQHDPPRYWLPSSGQVDAPKRAAIRGFPLDMLITIDQGM
jgi:hypothetical protein